MNKDIRKEIEYLENVSRHLILEIKHLLLKVELLLKHATISQF